MGLQNLSGEAFKQRWIQGFNGAYNKWRAGIGNVDASPCQQAAQAADKWANNTVAAKNKFIRNLEGITTQQWQNMCFAVQSHQWGVNDGSAAASKVAAFGDKLMAKLNQIVPAIRNMPSTSAPEMKARMIAYFDAMAGWDPDA